MACNSITFTRHLQLQSPLLLLASSSFYRLPNPKIFPLFSSMEQYWSGTAISRNKGMIEQLQRYGGIRSEKVVEVMKTIDRALFVPEGTPAYVDSPASIGYNATISAPHMHAMCLQLLEDKLQPGMHALDVGTGYLTACFALMVGPKGRVVGVEHIPELVAWSMKNVEQSAAAPLIKDGSLSLHVGDGRKGWPEHAPYDYSRRSSSRRYSTRSHRPVEARRKDGDSSGNFFSRPTGYKQEFRWFDQQSK